MYAYENKRTFKVKGENIMHKFKLSNRAIAYLFLLPNIIGFLIFTLTPVIVSFGLSFTDWNGFNKSNFVGISNYTALFQDESFHISLKNTLYYMGLSVPLTLMLALLVAVGLNKKIKGIKAFRTAFFLPYLSATVAVAVVWQLIFHPTMGPLNAFLMTIGVQNPPRWLSSSQWAMTSVIIVSIWKSIGYYMIIFLAGLQGLDESLIEAAGIDGANKWEKFIYIILPMLSPTIFFATIIAIINSFKVFDQIYILTQGGPGRSTNVLAYTIYNEAFVKYKFGYASAMAYVLFAMIMIITFIQFRGQKKWVNY